MITGLTIFFLTIFPSLRVLLIGKQNADEWFEYFVAALPDILILGSFFYVFYQRKLNSELFYLSKFDRILLIVIAVNIVIGCILSCDLKLILLGLRLSYIPMLFYFTARLIPSAEFKERIKYWLNTIVLWFTCFTFVGLIIYYFFPDFEDFISSYIGANNGEYFIKRFNSIFYSPTVNGMFCCMSSLFYLIHGINKPTFKTSILMSINFWGLLLTVSRGGIIAFLLLLIISLFFYKKWKNSLLILTTLITVFFITLNSVGLTLNNFSWIFQSTSETFKLEEKVSRVQLWKQTFRDLTERPFGYGIGKSGWIAYRFLKDNKNEESAYMATDGWYLKLANETGLIGLISFIFLFVLIFYRFQKHLKTSEDIFFIYTLFIAVVIINIVSNVLDYFLFNLLFWFLIGIVENYNTREQEKAMNT
jgi:O-antigen ligase